MDITNKTARDLLAGIIREPFAWPGGYARLLVLEDGALLCHACCRKEARRVMSDVRDNYDTGASTSEEHGSVSSTALPERRRKRTSEDDRLRPPSRWQQWEAGCSQSWKHQTKGKSE